LTSVTSSGTSARSTTTLTMVFTTPDTDANDDLMDYIGVELPHGWGNVLAGGHSSFGAATVANESVIEDV